MKTAETPESLYIPFDLMFMDAAEGTFNFEFVDMAVHFTLRTFAVSVLLLNLYIINLYKKTQFYQRNILTMLYTLHNIAKQGL